MTDFPETVSDKSPPAKRGRGRPRNRDPWGLSARVYLPHHTDRSIYSHDRAEHVRCMLSRDPELASWFERKGGGPKLGILVALSRFPDKLMYAYARACLKHNLKTGHAVWWLRREHERRIAEIHALDLADRRAHWPEEVCTHYRCLKPPLEGRELCRKHDRARRLEITAEKTTAPEASNLGRQSNPPFGDQHADRSTPR